MNTLEKLFEDEKNRKLTENGDEAYISTGDKLVDILFMTEYYQNHLTEVKIGDSDTEKLFSMFIRDPRYGLGKRDLGRVLMTKSKVTPENVVKAGRFDDLLHMSYKQQFNHDFIINNDFIKFLYKEVKAGNELAKKWCPRLNTSNEPMAKLLMKIWKLNEKQYRKLIKCESTTEYKLTHRQDDLINFEHVPSLAMIKYFSAFYKRMPERFKQYQEDVKSGKKELKVSTTNVYDIYKNRDKIDAQVFFDKLEKIKINCIPILDTSGSMQDSNDSIGKATSIAHYLSKCSNYCPDYVMSFSSHPQLIHMGVDRKPSKDAYGLYWSNQTGFKRDYNTSNYINEVNSLYTGDCSNTDFGAVMKLLSNLDNDLPEYLVVLSDMEFDQGSQTSKDDTMDLFKQKGYKTRIIWWNFNLRNTTVPEIDKDGNIFISGYSPFLLKYLQSGFDGKKFLEELLKQYKENISK